MAIKMRNNTDPDAFCCECGEGQREILNMFDLLVGDTILTICDVCNEKILTKTLKAECFKNGRVKSHHDINIINERKRKQGLGYYEELAQKVRDKMEKDK